MKSRHSPASPGSWDGKDLLWNQCQERGIGSFPNFSSLLVPWFFNVYIYFNFFFFSGTGIFFSPLSGNLSQFPGVFIKKSGITGLES